MRRALVAGVVVAVMLVACSASAQMYASLRMTGTGNYDLLSSMMWGMYRPIYGIGPVDQGIFNHKELALGFGDEFQGEVSVGFSTFKYTWEDEGETRFDEELAFNWFTLGAAGFYQILETEHSTVDFGVRFQWHSAKIEDDYSEDYSDAYKVSGWSIGPVLRHNWELADGAITIGPEIYPKYTSLSSEYEETYPGRGTSTEDGPNVTAFDIDYSLRLDFHF